MLLVRSQMEMRNVDERQSGYQVAENLAELYSVVEQQAALEAMNSDI